MPGPNSVNLNRPVQAGGYNPNQPGTAQAPNLKDFALTIDDFRQFASGKYNAGAAPGTRAGVQRTWERLESPKIRPSEAPPFANASGWRRTSRSPRKRPRSIPPSPARR